MAPNKLLRTSALLLPRARPVGTSTTSCLRRSAATAQTTGTSRRHAHSSSIVGGPRRPQPTSRGAALPPAWSGWRVSGRRTIFIQTEGTPNVDAIKFLPNHRVLDGEGMPQYVEYLNARSTIAPPYPSPLAAQLMAVDGVIGVFYGPNFITVTKAADAHWAHIRPEVFALITEAITSGQPIVNLSSAAAAEDGGEGAQAEMEKDSLEYDENDSEVVGMIKELLETRIRPAIQEDGGDVEFRGFVDGIVKLRLRGACRTCDSSTITLKSGIEGMMMHYIEEVKGVEQAMDQEEEISLQEFAKFEEKLKTQKGSHAVPPSTTAKETLDTVPG